MVGVVGDARLNAALSEADPAMYMSADQGGYPVSRLVIRTSGDPAGLAVPLREIVRGRDRTVPILAMMPMSAVVDRDASVFRLVSLSLGIYSGVALLLTAIGLFGALAYHVVQQQGEMSVRLALGATPAALLARVFSRGFALAETGLTLGVIASVGSQPLLQRLPFTLKPQGVSSLAMVIAGLGAVAVAACLIPAWRAMRISPMEALRKE